LTCSEPTALSSIWLELVVEGEDRLGRDGRAQRGDVAAALAALQAIDARPFADIVAVGGTAIEKILLEARHERRLRIVFFAVRIAGRKAHVEARLGEEALLDADDDRQVEDRVVRRDADGRSILFGLHISFELHGVSSRLRASCGAGPTASRLRKFNTPAAPVAKRPLGGSRTGNRCCVMSARSISTEPATPELRAPTSRPRGASDGALGRESAFERMP
jgi:hypothetical protein